MGAARDALPQCCSGWIAEQAHLWAMHTAKCAQAKVRSSRAEGPSAQGRRLGLNHDDPHTRRYLSPANLDPQIRRRRVG